MADDHFIELLIRFRPALVRFLQREASGLRRFESPEDIAQGVHLHALRVEDRFEYRGERAFRSWLFEVARRYVARRAAHWRALKRDAGPMLRITFGGASTGASGHAPPHEGPGPLTWANVRERVHGASRAIDALPQRDQAIVRMIGQGLGAPEIAERLGVGPEAAKTARRRAIERFRKLMAIRDSIGSATPA